MTKTSCSMMIVLMLALTGRAVPSDAALTCYPLIPAQMVTTVDSARGFSGQVFQFKTTETVSSNGLNVPAASIGYGVVLNAIPASNRARNGIVVLEPRFLLVGG